MLSIAEQAMAAALSVPYEPPSHASGKNREGQKKKDFLALSALKLRPRNRGELAEVMGVNASSTTKRIRKLQDDGLVEDDGRSMGRKVRITEAGLKWLKDNPCA